MALGVTDGYTEEDYLNFKRTALVAATSFSSNAKEGCQNEFALLWKLNWIHIYQI